jgi:hypothetical protein
MPTEVGGGFYWVLRGACRAAAELRQPEIGTDTLLISLMNQFPAFRRVLGSRPAGALGGAPGSADDNHVEISPGAELELLRTMREVHWQEYGWSRAVPPRDVPQWAAEAKTAARLAMAIAVARNAPRVGADHLLEALLMDPANGASCYVRQQGVDLELLTQVARRTWIEAGGEPPWRALVDLLHRARVLVESGDESRRRSTALTHRLTAGAVRLVAGTGPVLAFLEQEAIAESVRLGHDRITLTHLVLAVLVLEEQMAATALGPVREYRAACDFVLRPFTLDRESVSVTVASIAQDGPIAPPQRRRSWRSSAKNPPWTVAAVRAAEAARSATVAGSAHLLRAVLADSDDSGRRLLREHAVDPAAVADLLARRLARTP